MCQNKITFSVEEECDNNFIRKTNLETGKNQIASQQRRKLSQKIF